jgi:transcriptional regulator with PAS, ATPase and Fis domain
MAVYRRKRGELFGYRKGAFSGANADYLGLFRAAEGGALFLDEVTEMAPETQSKLLRAVQERSVRPVGSTKETPVNVRLIASTNRDPEEAVRAGNLRQDLYYRLQAGVLSVPPLRERSEDIPLLVEHFIELFNEKLQPRIPVRGIEEDAIAAMVEYSMAWECSPTVQRYRRRLYFRPLTFDPVARPASRRRGESA